MIKKAILPMAGLGTRFLPLSKILPKEIWPLVDKPVIQYIVEEAKNSGIEEIIFVLSPEKKFILDYFKKSKKLEKILRERKREHLLKEVKNLEELTQDLSFSFVFQKEPRGDGQAIFLAKDKIKKEPFSVLFSDDIVDSKTPCLFQLMKVFKTGQKPVIALSRVSREKISAYGIVGTEKIANRFYKIKKILEKPNPEKAPSNLAIVGKFILTPEIFEYLKKEMSLKERGEILLVDALNKMIDDGKIIYGYEFEGKWLECGNKISWLESHFYLSLKHQTYGPRLRKYLQE